MMRQKKSVNGRQFRGGFPCVDLGCGENTGKVKVQAGIAYRWHFLLLMVSFLLPLWAPAVDAAEVKLTPGLAVGGAYDDNVLLSTEQKVSSSIVTVSPSVNLDYKTLVSNLRLKADWDILSYLDESDLDRTNQYYRLSGDHQIKERWKTSADFKYFRDTTLNTYLQETGRVIDRVERDYFDAGGRVGYSITDISWLSAGYRYENASYEGDIYSDYDSHRGNLFYSHRLKTEVDTLSVGPSYYHRANDFNDVDQFALNIGWARDWSSISSSDASIGATYTKVKRDDGTEDDNWGARASVEYSYEGIVSTTTFRYFHDLRTTVAGDDINVDNFYLTYSRSITERFGAGMDGRLVFSYKLNDEQSNVNDSRYYWVEPRLFYRFTKNLDLSLRYRYQNNVEMLDEGDRTRERNIVWLQLSYGFPMLL